MVTINGIGGIPEPRPERPSNVRDRERKSDASSSEQDGVAFSESALEAAGKARLLQLAEAAPDIRADRVVEARERLEREDFRLREVVVEVARRISVYLE